MHFNLDDAIPILSRTPATLDTLLRGLPEVWIHNNEGESTWSPFDVLGHLIHGEETDWIPRLRIILEHGTSQTFEPFDRFAQEKNSVGKSLDDLLDEFVGLRAQNIEALRGFDLKPSDLEKEGVHPELGRVNVGHLLSTWVVHDLGHIAQVTRVMAKQYGDETGPWFAYIGVLQPRTSGA